MYRHLDEDGSIQHEEGQHVQPIEGLTSAHKLNLLDTLVVDCRSVPTGLRH